MQSASYREGLKMDDFTAIGLEEGFFENADEAQVIEAWQYLVDTELVWQLQGWFGRTANRLIEQGILTLKGA
jgi:hypothetical protein